MAEKNRPQNRLQDDPGELIDEVTERVFINYEPPRDRPHEPESEGEAEHEGHAA
jgi:hypothetical protein